MLLRLEPIEEPAATAHRNKRLAGLASIISLMHQMEEIQRPAPDTPAVLARTAAVLGLREKLLAVVDHLSFEIEVRTAFWKNK